MVFNVLIANPLKHLVNVPCSGLVKRSITHVRFFDNQSILHIISPKAESQLHNHTKNLHFVRHRGAGSGWSEPCVFSREQ